MVQPLKMAALAGALCTCIYPGLLANLAGVVGVAGFPEVVGTGYIYGALLEEWLWWAWLSMPESLLVLGSQASCILAEEL
jgi:hypothetical protein